jgi:hypothetical protein
MLSYRKFLQSSGCCVARYNEIIEDVETDSNLKIEFRQ